jgi:hypothetical protein
MAIKNCHRRVDMGGFYQACSPNRFLKIHIPADILDDFYRDIVLKGPGKDLS